MGGTFPTQALMRDPPTLTVHEPQSPLREKHSALVVWRGINNTRIRTHTVAAIDLDVIGAASLQSLLQSTTHFLHEYLGLTPSLAHAAFNGVPSLTSIFFPLAEASTVILRELEVRGADDVGTKACADPTRTPQRRALIEETFIV